MYLLIINRLFVRPKYCSLALLSHINIFLFFWKGRLLSFYNLHQSIHHHLGPHDELSLTYVRICIRIIINYSTKEKIGVENGGHVKYRRKSGCRKGLPCAEHLYDNCVGLGIRILYMIYMN